MRRRPPHYIEPDDDGLVNFRGRLVTPAQAHWQAEQHMIGFDDMPLSTRNALNYAGIQRGMNVSKAATKFTPQEIKRAKASAAANILDELGL